MHCFLGLLQPNRGQVTVLGHRPTLGHALFDDVIYLPEEPHYHPYLTVGEAVEYYARLYRRHLTGTDIADAITRVGLQDFRRLAIDKCSKGMKQKVGLAVCLLFKPRLLFMDEPTRGLDPIIVRDFRDYLVTANRAGTTVILNSHVLSEVEMVCNRVAIIQHGRVLAQDNISKLIRASDDLYEITLDPGCELPEYVAKVQRAADLSRGQVPAAQLGELVAYCQIRHIRLYECRLKRETLEDVYLRIVGTGTGHQEARP
jgi:ABC-2 type transport system ATP-binding protein